MPIMTVTDNESGQRLDKYIRKLFPGMPIGHIYKLLRTRKVRVNGKRPRLELIVQKGDQIIFHMDEERFKQDTKRPKRKAGRCAFRIVFEDDQLLVVAKPAGLSVHEGKGHENDSLINQVHDYLEVSDGPTAFRPSLAHRLDRDTSGLLLIGKTGNMLRALGHMLKNREVEKHYLALVKGIPTPQEGVWKFKVQRRDVPGHDKPVRLTEEKPGLTQYRVAVARTIHSHANIDLTISLLDIRLMTGRTHQIRSHLLQAGHCLAGDLRYGETEFNRMLRKRYNLRRHFLHAYRIELIHPLTKSRLILTDDYPEDLQSMARSLRLEVPGKRSK